jgi:type 1 glutamine amidotransferase
VILRYSFNAWSSTAGMTTAWTIEHYVAFVSDPFHYKVLATTRFSRDHAVWIEDSVMPVAWKRHHGKGRVFYSSLGHASSTWDDPSVYRMYFEALKWSLGLTDGDATPRPMK